MASITPQYTESNLTGNLTESVDAVVTTIKAEFLDRITGDQRTPLSSTKLFVIDKGSEQFPNSNYEIVLATSHSTDANGITTLTGCTRGLAFFGTSLAAGTGTTHIAQAEIGCVDVHFLWTILVGILDGTYSPPAFKIGTPITFELAGVFADRIFANDAARDAAIPSPTNGMSVYNTAAGTAQDYIAGAWTNRAAGATPNASETVAGKVELATNAEMGTGTSTGGTGARLVPPNDQLVKTSSGAADANKIAVLNNSGQFDSGFVAALSTTIFDAKGDLITATADNTPARLAVGSNNQVLIADSAQASGLKWGTVPLVSANFKGVAVQRGGTTASGTQNVAHGLGKTPSFVIIDAFYCPNGVGQTQTGSSGTYDGTNTAMVNWTGTSANPGNISTTNIISIYDAVNGGTQVATVTVDATNVSLAWTKTGTLAAENINIIIKVFG